MPVRPVVEARRLGLRLPGGWAYRDVDLVVLPGELIVLVGHEDGGRSQLLLTLATELTATEGLLEICGHLVRPGTELARSRLTLARQPAHLTNDTTVGDAVEARLLLSDLRPDNDLFDAAADLLGLSVAWDAVVADLPLLQQRLLTMALAAMTPAQLILLDDADRDLGPVDRRVLWRALASVTRTGPAVIAGASMATARADQVLTVRSDASKFIT